MLSEPMPSPLPAPTTEACDVFPSMELAVTSRVAGQEDGRQCRGHGGWAMANRAEALSPARARTTWVRLPSESSNHARFRSVQHGFVPSDEARQIVDTEAPRFRWFTRRKCGFLGAGGGIRRVR